MTTMLTYCPKCRRVLHPLGCKPCRNRRLSERLNGAKRHKRRVWVRNEFKPDRSMRRKYDKRMARTDTPRRAYERARYARLKEAA